MPSTVFDRSARIARELQRRSGIAGAQANAANAQQDVDRYRPLLVDNAISKQEYDSAVARLRSAQADVAQARAQVERARLSLSYTTVRSEEHTSELQSLMRISYAVFCLTKNNPHKTNFKLITTR